MKTHVLLIDDDLDDMKAFAEALNEVLVSAKCTYASNGIQALKMLNYLRPDTIFVDYNMPVMNGLEFTEQLRKHTELQHVPLFLYSTHISYLTIQKASELGITACLEKPCTRANLISTLKNVFKLAAKN